MGFWVRESVDVAGSIIFKLCVSEINNGAGLEKNVIPAHEMAYESFILE